MARAGAVRRTERASIAANCRREPPWCMAEAKVVEEGRGAVGGPIDGCEVKLKSSRSFGVDGICSR